jgi:hypothetical protein
MLLNGLWKEIDFIHFLFDLLGFSNVWTQLKSVYLRGSGLVTK